MRKSRVVSVPIGRLYEDAYRILQDPLNYPRWSPMPDASFRPVGDSGLDFVVDLPRGRRVLRFSAPNDYGVLDYSVLSEGGEHQYTARLRLLPNDDGAELIAVFFQRPDQSDEEFVSETEWAANDFKAIAAVVEQF